MGYELAQNPEVYIRRTLVYSYITKLLRNVPDGTKMILILELAIRNNKGTLGQGGVKILNRKSLTDTITVKYSYKDRVYSVSFDKENLLAEAKNFYTDKNMQEFILLGGI